MEDRRANRRLTAIIVLGVLLCSVGVAVRTFHRKPIHGTWLGYSYVDVGGKKVKDENFGEYLITLNTDGTYLENGNSTSGKWKQVGDTITLNPEKFQGLTPAEHRKRFQKPDGKVSATIERLLEMKMKPMIVTYHAGQDRISHEEPTIHYEYERSN